MKVFEFDRTTGKRGKQVGNVVCHAYGNYGDTLPSVTLPAKRTDTTVDVAGHASDARNKPITAAQFGCESVCFCIGNLTCGTDTTWNWVILVTPLN
jgi:hypothetical protein